MQIVYVGPFEAVEIPKAGVRAENGVPLEVDDELGAALLEQTDAWIEAGPADQPEGDAFAEDDEADEAADEEE